MTLCISASGSYNSWRQCWSRYWSDTYVRLVCMCGSCPHGQLLIACNKISNYHHNNLLPCSNYWEISAAASQEWTIISPQYKLVNCSYYNIILQNWKIYWRGEGWSLVLQNCTSLCENSIYSCMYPSVQSKLALNVSRRLTHPGLSVLHAEVCNTESIGSSRNYCRSGNFP